MEYQKNNNVIQYVTQKKFKSGYQKIYNRIMDILHIEDETVNRLLSTNLWRLQTLREWEKRNVFCLYSNMKGFYDGRYRIEITKLKRRVEGKIYKVYIYYTPYNPDNIVYSGRVDNYNELVEAIGSVNNSLLDESRAIYYDEKVLY